MLITSVIKEHGFKKTLPLPLSTLDMRALEFIPSRDQSMDAIRHAAAMQRIERRKAKATESRDGSDRAKRHDPQKKRAQSEGHSQALELAVPSQPSEPSGEPDELALTLSPLPSRSRPRSRSRPHSRSRPPPRNRRRDDECDRSQDRSSTGGESSTELGAYIQEQGQAPPIETPMGGYYIPRSHTKYPTPPGTFIGHPPQSAPYIGHPYPSEPYYYAEGGGYASHYGRDNYQHGHYRR